MNGKFSHEPTGQLSCAPITFVQFLFSVFRLFFQLYVLSFCSKREESIFWARSLIILAVLCILVVTFTYSRASQGMSWFTHSSMTRRTSGEQHGKHRPPSMLLWLHLSLTWFGLLQTSLYPIPSIL